MRSTRFESKPYQQYLHVGLMEAFMTLGHKLR